MSFWKESPGPTWWDCIESLNPCVLPPYGICNQDIQYKSRVLTLPQGLHNIPLSIRHAEDIEKLLREHFTIYPRCRISLSKERIHQGFFLDGWIGVGVYTHDKRLIGCCISKPLGSIKFSNESIQSGGVIDYYCVHKDYRKQGVASFLLDEILVVTAQRGRLSHIFLKEGFPLWSLPPLYHGQYIARKKGSSSSITQAAEYFHKSGIATHTTITSFTHAEYLPLTKFAANLPKQLSGDSELFGFNYKGYNVYLCMTDIYHRTVPEGFRIGELSWILPQTIEVPISVQRLAVETCVENSKFDIVLMDSKIPHSPKKGWTKDSTYSWYIFNYTPGCFFKVKPFWIF